MCLYHCEACFVPDWCYPQISPLQRTCPCQWLNTVYWLPSSLKFGNCLENTLPLPMAWFLYIHLNDMIANIYDVKGDCSCWWKQIRRTLTLMREPVWRWGTVERVWSEKEEWQKARPHLGCYKVCSGILAPPYSLQSTFHSSGDCPSECKLSYAAW